MTTQTEIINLEDLVPTNHLYRKFTKLIDLDKITNKHLTTIAGNSNCQVSPRCSLSPKITLRNISGSLINKSGFRVLV